MAKFFLETSQQSQRHLTTIIRDSSGSIRYDADTKRAAEALVILFNEIYELGQREARK